jgi:hypothetical protein
MSEQEIFGKASLLGTCEIPLTPLLPELIDVYGLGIRQNVKFTRTSASVGVDGSAPTVGLALVTLKLIGDYVTKFDGPADHIAGGPKQATGQMHVLPAESPNFKWRIRCDLHCGENLPLNNVVALGLPSTYL